MGLVDGRGIGPQPPDEHWLLALRLTHRDGYLRAKADIMLPLREFSQRVAARLESERAAAQAQAREALWAVLLLMALLLLQALVAALSLDRSRYGLQAQVYGQYVRKLITWLTLRTAAGEALSFSALGLLGEGEQLQPLLPGSDQIARNGRLHQVEQLLIPPSLQDEHEASAAADELTAIPLPLWRAPPCAPRSAPAPRSTSFPACCPGTRRSFGPMICLPASTVPRKLLISKIPSPTTLAPSSSTAACTASV